MTYERLQEWIDNYFPEPDYTRDDVESYMRKHVPAWKEISKSDKEGILGDWEAFVLEGYKEEYEATEREMREIREGLGVKPKGFWARLRHFLGGLFK